jgi:ferredoxin
MMDSPREVLGVGPDADEEALDRAYRERVKEVHPDHGGSTDAFQRVRAAYETLQAGEPEWPEGGPATDTDARPGAPTEPEPQPTRVEYLNYEALDDHGWALDDEDLFERAADANLDPPDHGTFEVGPGESLLEAAERRGYAWPFACRGGACANCAVAVVAGELSQPVDHILTPDLLDRGFRLSCNGVPLTDELQVVFNVKGLPGLDELRLPPGPFELAHADD